MKSITLKRITLMSIVIGVLHGCMATQSKLTKAVSGGDIVAVEAALKDGSKIDEYDGFGKTALITAVINNNLDIARTLLSSGANPSQCTEQNTYCPVVAAARNGNTAMLKLLVDAGADINQAEADGTRAIHVAVIREQSAWELTGANKVEKIIANTKNVNEMLKMYGAGSEQFKTALQKLKPPTGENGTPEQDVAYYLIERGAEVAVENGNGEYPIVLAAKSGRGDVVNLLLDAGADINVMQRDGHRAIHEAAKQNRAKVVDLLLARGADVNSRMDKGMTPLIFAATNGHVEIIQTLLTAGADINLKDDDGITAMIYGGAAESDETFMLLLAAGGDVNQASNKGYRAIHYAAMRGRANAINRLVAAGAEVDVLTRGEEWSPLAMAAKEGSGDAVKALLAAGANPDLTGSDGISALYLAAGSKKKTDDVINYLIAAGADLDMKQGRYRWTALHSAADKGYYGTVKQLLEGGANPNIRDVDGETPLDRASVHGYATTKEYLASFGGRTNTYKEKRRSSGDNFGKIFSTLAIAGMAGNANLSADQTAQVMSATVNDIWVEEGRGTQLGSLYRDTMRSNDAAANNPTVRDMMVTRNQQQNSASNMNAEIARYRAMLEQQRALKGNGGGAKMQPPSSITAGNNHGKAGGVSNAYPDAMGVQLNSGTTSSLTSGWQSKQTTYGGVNSTSVSMQGSQTMASRKSTAASSSQSSMGGCQGTSSSLPAFTVEGRATSALVEYDRKKKDYMESACGARGVMGGGYRAVDRVVLKERTKGTTEQDYIRITASDGGVSCGCGDGSTARSQGGPGAAK